MGPEWNMQQSMTVLNRTIRWQGHGIEYEPDQRHAELIIESMGVSSGKGVSTPVVADSLQDPASRMHSAELCSTEASRYRAVAARLNYLAQDRFELQFAAKVASKNMSCPREVDWQTLKRVAMYLVQCPRSVQTFEWQLTGNAIVTHTDRDWAGDKQDRKSTSGGTMSLGAHTIKTWSSPHSIA